MRVSMVRDGVGPISARHRFGDDKMFNFTKPFSRTQTNSFSIVYLHDNLYLYDPLFV